MRRSYEALSQLLGADMWRCRCICLSLSRQQPCDISAAVMHYLYNSDVISLQQPYSILYACLRLRFLDAETNPGPRRPVPAVGRILSSYVRGQAVNLRDPTLASSQYDILLSSETLVSDIRHVSKLLVPLFGGPVLLFRDRMPLARGMVAYARYGYGAFRQPKFECGCCEMLVFRVFGVRQNRFVTGGVFEWHCSSSICGSTVYAA